MNNIEQYQATHIVTSDYKLEKMGYGEWVEEPDEITFFYKNFKCRVIRDLKEMEVKCFDGEIEYLCFGNLGCYVQIMEDELYLGYECRGFEDLIPGVDKHLPTRPPFSNTYRNVKFCIEICKTLVNEILETYNKVTTHEKQKNKSTT